MSNNSQRKPNTVEQSLRGGGGEITRDAHEIPFVDQSVLSGDWTNQVLSLDGKERKYVEEVGTMNIFFKFKDELATAPLAGTILLGITRDSIITLAKHLGLAVNERAVTIDEVIRKAKSGDLEEVFGSGRHLWRYAC